MKVLWHIGGHITRILVLRLTQPRNNAARMARLSLILLGASLLAPWWQPVIEAFVAAVASTPQKPEPSFPLWVAPGVFVFLAVIFALLAVRFARRPLNEPLVHSPVISPPIQVGTSEVCSFCGSIELIDRVDAIVTSENQHLTLGSINGTSVSGRVRRMAAEKNVDGKVVRDPLFEAADAWKKRQPHLGPYLLGTTIVTEPFENTSSVCPVVFLAIALEKRDSGVNNIDPQAICLIVKFVLDECERRRISRIYYPVFGSGSGGIPPAEAVDAALEPLVRELSGRATGFQVLVGTYKASHAALVLAGLVKRR